MAWFRKSKKPKPIPTDRQRSKVPEGLWVKCDGCREILCGVAAIADYLGDPPRRVYHLLLTGQIPAFKLGGRWYARRSSLRAQIERLEREAGDE